MKKVPRKGLRSIHWSSETLYDYTNVPWDSEKKYRNQYQISLNTHTIKVVIDKPKI